MRADVRAGPSDNIFIRYIYTDRTRFVPGWFGGTLDGTSTSAWGRNYLKSHSTVGGWMLMMAMPRAMRTLAANGTLFFIWMSLKL